jgi:beta-lactam-binding protein with PASTA domain
MEGFVFSIAMSGILNVWLDMILKASKITIPNLQRLQVTTVKPQLELLGLQVECYYLSSDLPKGSIVTQNPIAGAEVIFGSKITLAIGYGANSKTELLTVPGVVGLSYEMAVEILNIKGFDRVQKILCPNLTSPSHSCSIVIAQIPRKGMKIDRDTEILLELRNSGCD